MRRYPPHHLGPARANHPAGQDPEARLAAPRHHSNASIKTESQSFLSKIVALTVRNSAKIPGKNQLFENWVVFSNRWSLLNGGHFRTKADFEFTSESSRRSHAAQVRPRRSLRQQEERN
jgi:hypothetical protein